MTAIPTTTATPVQSTSLTSTASTRTPTQDYNSQMFLKLLTTQLANQDPSSPMDSTQMISQTSQLASMEQLTNLSTTTTDSYSLNQRSAAANLIGKTVSWTDSSGVAQTGTASSVTFSTDGPTVTVGSSTVAMSDLTGIAAATATASA
jgi:flagellar basal-body rod modification protein FlgD